MKRSGLAETDPDLARVLPALKRAAAAAWQLSVETGTPFYVMENGRIVDRHADRPRRSKRVGRSGGRGVGRP